MLKLHVTALLSVSVCGSLAAGFDLSDLRQNVIVEPDTDLRSAQYCLLVFGTDGATRRWLAVDGERILWDRNGNGVLTDDGQPIQRTESGWSNLGDVVAADGTYRMLRIRVESDNSFRVRVTTPTRGGQYVGFGRATRPVFSSSPGSAPIIHFGGPMTLGQYGPKQSIPRELEGVSYRVSSLKLMLGTPGVGRGTFAAYHCNCRHQNGNDGTLVGKFVYDSSELGEAIQQKTTYGQRG